jgi:hypothetical protein
MLFLAILHLYSKVMDENMIHCARYTRMCVVCGILSLHDYFSSEFVGVEHSVCSLCSLCNSHVYQNTCYPRAWGPRINLCCLGVPLLSRANI